MPKEYNENLIGKVTCDDFYEKLATVRLHQNNPIVTVGNIINISIGECEVGSFIERLRKQIDKVTIEFMHKDMCVDIYFKEKK